MTPQSEVQKACINIQKPGYSVLRGLVPISFCNSLKNESKTNSQKLEGGFFNKLMCKKN